MKKWVASCIVSVMLLASSVTASAECVPYDAVHMKVLVDEAAERVRICYNHKVTNFDTYLEEYLKAVELYIDIADPVDDCTDMIDILNTEKFWLDLLERS